MRLATYLFSSDVHTVGAALAAIQPQPSAPAPPQVAAVAEAIATIQGHFMPRRAKHEF